MKRFRGSVVLSLAPLLAMSSSALAQREPHIGYVYPAGGRQGTELELTVGGQFLAGVSAAHVSGDGVEASVLEHIKPLTQQQLNDLRQKLRELERRVQAAARKRGAARARGKPAGNNEVKEIAEELGLDVTDMKSLAALRKKYFDPKKQPNPQLAELVRVKIVLGPDAVPGKRELRLICASGVTNPLRFHVSRWTERLEVEPNDRSADIAAAVPELPAILNGQILPGDVDRFRFRARKGERIVIATSARELIPYLADAVPGWFQAVLALYDAGGAELAYADDFRFDPDPVLCYEIPADGAYELEIRDAIYRGREDFVYRIAIGELPFVTSVFPLGGRAGLETNIELKGWNLAVNQVKTRAAKSGPAVQNLDVCKDGTTRELLFAVDTLPECLEREPNDAPETAQALELPGIVNGRIDRPGDEDVFQFEGRAGEEIVAEVMARRLNSPLDSVLELTDASGLVLAFDDDHEDRGEGLSTHHADSRLQCKLPSDGVFRLRLRDAQHQGGAACGYRLRLSPPRPDFQLRLVPSSASVRAGATVPITLYALRKDGFTGEIALELKDAPPGFSLSGGRVPAGADRVRFTLTVPAEPPEDPVSLSLVGGAVIGGRKLCRPAVPADDRMQAFIYRHLVPAQEWLVAVTGRGRSRGMKIVGEQPLRLTPGGTARVRIDGAFQANQLRLALDAPPPGIVIQKVSADRQGVSIVLRASGKVQPGLTDNLIVKAFVEREVKARGGVRRAGKRRVPVGALPAIPLEVTGRPRNPGH